MAEIDSLGINLERYFKLSFIIIDVVYLDANLRIMLNYVQWINNKSTGKMPNK